MTGVTVSTLKSGYASRPGHFRHHVNAERFLNAVGKRRVFRTFCDIFRTPVKLGQFKRVVAV